MSDVLASYHPGAAYDEMIDSEGEVRPAYTAVHSTLGRAQPSRAAHDRRIAGQQLLPGRRDLRRRRGRASLPARPGPAGDRGRGMARDRDGGRPAGPGPRGVPRRRLRRGPGDHRRGDPAPTGLLLDPLPPGGVGHRARQRGPGPRGRRGSDPNPRRRRPGAGGQRPGAERRLVRHDQSQRHDHRDAGRVQPPGDPAGGRLPATAAGRVAGRGAQRCRRPDRGGADPRASSTPPTSSTPCWPAPWASSWSRAATWSAGAARSSCAPRAGCSGST